MAKHTAVLIPGDGIGPEVTRATQRVLEAAKFSVEWVEMLAGASALEQGMEDVLPARTLAAVAAHKIALKGPVTTPVGKGFKSVNVQLRQKLGLYAAIRPVRNLPGIKTRYETRVGQAVPDSTVYRLLARHQWRQVQPRPKHPKDNPAARAAFKKTSDQSGRRRGWAPAAEVTSAV